MGFRNSLHPILKLNVYFVSIFSKDGDVEHRVRGPDGIIARRERKLLVSHLT